MKRALIMVVTFGIVLMIPLPLTTEENEFNIHIGQVVPPITCEFAEEKPIVESIYTEADVALMARVVMSESGGLPYEAKLMVASTLDNRMKSDKFPDTMQQIVAEGYWTGNNGDVTDECYRCVNEIIEYNPFPEDLFYFRIDYPHKFGYQYAHIGNTYFSTELDYDTLVKGDGK